MAAVGAEVQVSSTPPPPLAPPLRALAPSGPMVSPPIANASAPPPPPPITQPVVVRNRRASSSATLSSGSPDPMFELGSGMSSATPTAELTDASSPMDELPGQPKPGTALSKLRKTPRTAGGAENGGRGDGDAEVTPPRTRRRSMPGSLASRTVDAKAAASRAAMAWASAAAETPVEKVPALEQLEPAPTAPARTLISVPVPTPGPVQSPPAPLDTAVAPASAPLGLAANATLCHTAGRSPSLCPKHTQCSSVDRGDERGGAGRGSNHVRQ